MFGGLFGGDQEQEVSNTPWGPQAEALQFAFDEARKLYSQGAVPVFTGDRVADLNGAQLDALGSMGNWAAGFGGDIFNTLNANASGQAGQWGGAADWANGTLNGNGVATPVNQGPDMGLVDSLYNSDLVNDQVDAATGRIYDNLYQNQITGINADAAASGNMGSSRAGVAEAMARNGAAQMAGDVSASIVGNAYNNAVNQAGNVAAQNASLGMQNNQLNANQGMVAAGMLNNMANSGMDNLAMANHVGTGNLTTSLQGGSLLQNQQQNEINADMQLFNEQANGGWDLLNRYYGVIGNGNWGGNQTMTTPDQTGNQLLQAGAQLGAAYLLASDRRLKTDLQPVGKRGPLTRYRWRWNDAAKRIGTEGCPTEGYIAQEVQLRYPQHVTTLNGYLAIDYAGLNRTLAQEGA